MRSGGIEAEQEAGVAAPVVADQLDLSSPSSSSRARMSVGELLHLVAPRGRLAPAEAAQVRADHAVFAQPAPGSPCARPTSAVASRGGADDRWPLPRFGDVQPRAGDVDVAVRDTVELWRRSVHLAGIYLRGNPQTAAVLGSSQPRTAPIFRLDGPPGRPNLTALPASDDQRSPSSPGPCWPSPCSRRCSSLRQAEAVTVTAQAPATAATESEEIEAEEESEGEEEDEESEDEEDEEPGTEGPPSAASRMPAAHSRSAASRV